MWAERMRLDWQHTSVLAAYLIDVNRAKKGRPTDPDKLNPMEATNGAKKSTEGVKLNSIDGFRALASISGWRPKPSSLNG